MRFIKISLLSILIPGGLWACLAADQNRIFPLGLCPKGLVVFETHLRRTDEMVNRKEPSSLNPTWRGISYFKIYDKNYKEVYSQVIDSIKPFSQNEFNIVIGKRFHKALLIAKKLDAFMEATPLSISFCDYNFSCSKASISCDSINNQILITLNDKKQYPVKVLFIPNSIASNVSEYYSGFNDSELNSIYFKDALYINSVRQFKIGNKLLTVVHLGAGQTMQMAENKYYPPGKEHKAPFEFSYLATSMYFEPVLHHGHGFDFFILSN